MVGPVHAQRGGGVLVVGRDAGLNQVVTDGGQGLTRCTIAALAPKGGSHQGEGAFHLAIGEGVGAGSPSDHNTQAALVMVGQGHQGFMDSAQMGGTTIGQFHQGPNHQGANPKLAGTPAGGQEGFYDRRHP